MISLNGSEISTYKNICQIEELTERAGKGV